MSKNIVICYDGTNSEYSEHNTNVVKAFEKVDKDNPKIPQIAMYDPGVGTINFLGEHRWRWIGIVLGLAFGYGIRQNIEDGYEYLMNNFKPGDKVFLFGFSRGAYTARALAGMIHKFGVLREGNKNMIPYVSKMYFKKVKNEDKDNYISLSKGFKEAFSNVCKPRFIGLWDTVGALGKNLSKSFPDLKLNPDVKCGFQAIAIDERRKLYKVVLWDESDKTDNQTIEQVWFGGVHSEVGGGCNRNKCSLSDIPFAWMMDKAFECGLNLKPGWQDNLNQEVIPAIHDSYKFPWVTCLLLKKRVIPSGAIIHQSIIDRMNKRDDYNPVVPNDKSIVSTGSYRGNI